MYKTPVLRSEDRPNGAKNDPQLPKPPDSPEISIKDLTEPTVELITAKREKQTTGLIVEETETIENVNIAVGTTNQIHPTMGRRAFSGVWQYGPVSVTKTNYAGQLMGFVDDEDAYAWALRNKYIVVGKASDSTWYFVADLSSAAGLSVVPRDQYSGVIDSEGRILPIQLTYLDYTKLCIMDGMMYIEAVVDGQEDLYGCDAKCIYIKGSPSASVQIKRVITEEVTSCSPQPPQYENNYEVELINRDTSSYTDNYYFGIKIVNHSSYPRLFKVYLYYVMNSPMSGVLA